MMMSPIKKIFDSIVLATSYLKTNRFFSFSLFINVIFVATFLYSFFNKPVNTPITTVVKNDDKILVDLKNSLEELRVEHQKNFKEYDQQMKAVLEAYNARISDLEDKKREEAKKIVSSHMGDMNGLAADFSSTMKIPVK